MMIPRNDDALEFFAKNPERKYWYWTPTLRVPNPEFYNRPDYQPDPWP